MTTSYRILTLALVCLVIVTTGLAVHARERERPGSKTPVATPQKGTLQVAPNLIIVKMKATASFTVGERSLGIATLDASLKRIGATRVTPFHRVPATLNKGTLKPEEASLARMFRIHFTDATDPRLVARELGADPSVEYAEPYYIFPVMYTPNDPMLSQQYAITMLKLKEAWDVTKGDSTIIIGDVDTGVDWTHQDLSRAVFLNKGEWGTSGELSNNGKDDDGDGYVDNWHGWDFVGSGTAQNPLPDNDPMDGTLGHGTNTSSCAAATADNSLGIAGTSFRSKVMPIKVASDNSAGLSEGYDGIKYAADHGCKVINCSWGGTGGFSQAMQDFVDYAFSKGALIVASAGNDTLNNDITPHFPSSLNHVLNVSSVEQDGNPSSWATYGTSVHVYAPGKSIFMAQKGGGYLTADGTSFSAPITAGVAALVMSVHPEWTPDQVAAQIRVTSDPFTGGRSARRYGRVNAYKAVTLNKTMSDVPGIRIKSVTVTTPTGDRLSAPGQTAHVEIVLENVLAPTSASAQALVELDDTVLTCPTGAISLGAIPTFGTKSVSFDLTLSKYTMLSESYQPVRLRITDGSYIDFVLTHVIVYLNPAWHTALTWGYPIFSSIDVQSSQNIWCISDITQNSVPAYDFCFRTSDGGLTWQNASLTGSNFPTGKGVYCVNTVSENVALVGTGPTNGQAAICRTLSGGQSWSTMSVASMTAFVDAIHMFDASNGIFIGDPLNGVWGIGRTSDAGRTWTPNAKPLSAPSGEAGWNNSCDFIGDIGWFGTNNSKIYKTTDRGLTWTSYPTPALHSLNVSFRDVNVGAIHFSAQNNVGTNALAITTDGGARWSLVNTIQITASADMIMEREGTRLWLILDGNVYVTRDLGKTWSVEAHPSGLNYINVSDMVNDAAQSHVWVGGIDLFKYITPLERTTAIQEPSALPRSMTIRRIYPNPASSSSAPVVEFSIAEAAHTELAVLDNAGRVVSVALAATLAPGEHAARLDVTQLPVGVYHCRLTSGAFSDTRTITVLR
jgi:subtilisin family serine protease/photosystem II stability/assembly factor-like uncharacterized protein